MPEKNTKGTWESLLEAAPNPIRRRPKRKRFERQSDEPVVAKKGKKFPGVKGLYFNKVSEEGKEM